MAEYMTYERLKELNFGFYAGENESQDWTKPVYPLLANGTLGEAETPVEGRFYAEEWMLSIWKTKGMVFCYRYKSAGENRVKFDRAFFRNAINGTIEARPEWFDKVKVEPHIGGDYKVRYPEYGKPDHIFLGDGGIAEIQFDERVAPKFNRLYMQYDSFYKKYKLMFFYENKPYGSYPYTKWWFRHTDFTEKQLLAVYHPPERFPSIFVKNKRINGLWIKQGQQLVKPSGAYVKQGGAIKKI